MSEPQTLEEAWEGLDTQVLELLRFDKNLTSDHIRDAKSAARALALAVLEEAQRRADMSRHGSMRSRRARFAFLRRRIEELGR